MPVEFQRVEILRDREALVELLCNDEWPFHGQLVLTPEDIGEGAPLFDLRVASRHRGCGFGMRATRWTVDHLFTSYPELHRIEAKTRHDNAAMQRVLSDAGFTHEGRLRDAWRSDEGQWFDTMIYGILRTEWTSTHRS